MSIYDASADKPHKMTQETFDFVMNCVDAVVNAEQDVFDRFYFDIIKDAILEKTEISG